MKKAKKLKEMKKVMNKWDLDVYVPTFSSLIYRIIMLRHKIKMAWFDANCEDKPMVFEGSLEDMTEEQVE